MKTTTTLSRNSRLLRWKYFLITIPFLLWFLAFSYVPVLGWSYAFVNYRLGKTLSEMPFVGFNNFIRIWDDRSDVIRVLRNTLAMSFLNISASFLPVVFAIMINEIRSSKYKRVLQTVTTLPHFISWIVVFGLAFAMFSSSGFIPMMLRAIGIENKSGVGIMGNKDFIWFFMLGISIWKNIGWNAIIYLAAIAGIDTDLYDAAKVDGANLIQSIMHITIPSIIPTYLVLLLLQVSNLLNNGFEQYFTFFNSLVASRIEVLDYYVYKLGILIGDYSLSVTVGMFKSIISIILLFTVNSIAKRLRGSSFF